MLAKEARPGKQRAFAALSIKEVVENGESWSISGIATTPTTDRVGDKVNPLGAKFQTPMPLLLYHDSVLPVGQVTFAKATKAGIPFEADLPKVKEAGTVQNRVNEAIHSLQYRLIGAVSIGFNPDYEKMEAIPGGGWMFNEWEWLELSLVTIPANPEAVITGRKSFDDSLHAAIGKSARGRFSPGASGNPPNRSPKGTAMKTIAQMREERETAVARMKELTELFKTDGHETTDEEGAEFDRLDAEVKKLDTDIRVARFHATNSAGAKSFDGSSSDGATQTRGATIIVRKEDPEDKFKGQSLTRFAMAKAAAFVAMKEGNFLNAGEWAERRWGKTHPNLVRYIKAGVAGGGTGSGEWGAELAQSDARYVGDFVEYLYSLTVFDRLPLRPIPARVHIKGQDGAATGYWVGESKAIPVSKPDFSDVELTPLKVGAIAVCSKELIADSDPSAELYIRDSIGQASAQRVDTTFLSAAAASSGVSPAGILNGLSALAPSGSDAAAVRADMMSLYAGFLAAKNASGLVQIMTPSMAKALALLVNALGQPEFVGLNANGGTLLGDPVFTGDNVTPGDWILLKPSDIWKIGDSGVQISMSDSAMVEQDDSPTGATDTPVAASAHMVSLWQEESIGFKCVRRINFAKRRASAVAVLSNAEYGGVVS